MNAINGHQTREQSEFWQGHEVRQYGPNMLEIRLAERLHYFHPESRRVETLSLANCVTITGGSLVEQPAAFHINALKERIENNMKLYGVTQLRWEREVDIP